MTGDLVLLISLAGAAVLFWRSGLRPWLWLLDDRIVPAGELLTAFNRAAGTAGAHKGKAVSSRPVHRHLPDLRRRYRASLRPRTSAPEVVRMLFRGASGPRVHLRQGAAPWRPMFLSSARSALGPECS